MSTTTIHPGVRRTGPAEPAASAATPAGAGCRAASPAPIAAARRAARVGGAALVLATLLFSAVFGWLARHFGYPDVLDRPAAEVLPALLALGSSGRAVWLVYGLVPLLLLPAGIGVQALGRTAAPLASRVAVLAAALAALAMAVGLLRWPGLHWQLALAFAEADPAVRQAIAVVFDGANSLLGTVIGEWLGELFLNLFFAASAVALAMAGGQGWRWLRVAGLGVALLGALAMQRNATDAVAALAVVNNLVLPVWLLVQGLVMLWLARAAGHAAR